MAKLTFVLEDGQAVVVPVVERVSLGREEGNDIVVDDQRISARHAELVRGAEGVFEVHDLASKAGTFVNGERVEQRRPVADGDKIAFGPLIAVFALEDPVPAANGGAGSGTAAVRETTLAGKIGKSWRQKAGGKGGRTERRPGVVSGSSKRKKNAPASTAAPVPEKSEEAPAALFARLDAGLRNGIENLEKDKMRLQGEVDALQKALRDWQDRAAKAQDAAHGEQTKLDDARKALAVAQAQIHSAMTREQQLQAQVREAAEELSTKGARVEKLRAEEERLRQVSESLRDAESLHAQWLDATHALSVQHGQKNAEVLRLAAAAERAAGELDSVEARKDEALARLRKLQEEGESGESRLGALRQQVAVLEARGEELRLLADARSDQLTAAEKRLEQVDAERCRIEAQIREMSGVEERLQKARALCLEMETKNRTLNAALATLSGEKQRAEEELGDLRERNAALQDERRRISGATDEARAAQAQVEGTLHRIHAEREAHEKDLATKREQLIAEMMRLDEARAKRAEAAAQGEAVVDSGRKLDETKASLAALVGRRDEIGAEVHDLEARRDNLKGVVGDLSAEEEAAEVRIEELRGREAGLHGELKDLAAAEQERRERFEEIRRLTAEAEKEFSALKEEMARSIEVSRRELADIEIKLAPLRDWKEAMDQRYARLAALPEDSAEARALWREIETEKGKLKNLISAAPGQTRGVSLNEAVLKGIAANVEKKAPVSKGVLHAPAAFMEDAGTPGQRANVGATGTGAMYSGTGQEMALKARISRLRESVQREAMRLEFLRQERAREETRTKSSPGGEAMMREHDRHLESKVRREEEHLATLQRKLELGEMEEEKRRDKIAELERKIVELRSDVTDAERHRSDLRHQADLVQTELRNYEAALDRVKKMTE